MACKGTSQEVNLELTQAEWQEDLDFLKKRVESTVPWYEENGTTNEFLRVYETLSATNPKNGDAFVFDLQRLLNSLKDEGCNLPYFQSSLGTKLLPLKVNWFSDGLFIVDANADNSSLLGAQIVKMNDTSIDEVFEGLKPFLNADNDHYKKYLFQAYGLMPNLLKAAGFGNDANGMELEFASGKKIRIESEPLEVYAKLNRKLPNDGVFEPLAIDHGNDNYWTEFIPDTKTLFVQIQKVVNNETGDSFGKFVSGIESLLANGKVDKLVLDLRYGGGGNGFKLKSFTDLLRDSERINKRGNLYVLISNATRGTLAELTSILTLNTKAILVGQPSAEGPNTVGDTKYITLPNSGLAISLTHTLWPTSWKQDATTALTPAMDISYNHTDKQANVDPWLNAVLQFSKEETPKSLTENQIASLSGSYKINGRKVNLETKNGRLFLTMGRKMKSFFEIHTEVYFDSENTLRTDIEGVELSLSTDGNGNMKPTQLTWNQQQFVIQ